MGRLIKAELLKLSKSFGYKAMLLFSAGLGILLGCLSFMFLDFGIETNGHWIYLQVLSETQIQILFAAVFAGIFICNEFSNRTFGIGIIGGCSRISLLLSKAVAYTVGLLSINLVYPIVGTIITTINLGFGETSPEIWNHLGITSFLFVIGIIAMGSVCFMLAILIKNIGGTIGAGIGVLLFLTLAGQFPSFSPVMRFTFTYQLAQAAQPESIFLYYAVICLTIICSLTISVNVFNRAELK